MRRGFILLEASVIYILLSFALVALLPLFILSIRANKNTRHAVAATQLAVELLEEVRLRRWDEQTPRPPLGIAAPSAAMGPDAGETASDKRTFDDIDDFNGWTEAAPLDPVQRPLTGFEGYARDVSVRFVDAALNPAAGPTDYKHVTVCARRPPMKPVCLDTLLSNR